MIVETFLRWMRIMLAVLVMEYLSQIQNISQIKGVVTRKILIA